MKALATAAAVVVVWVGHFAMPVPQSVTETPGGGEKEALKIVLVVWEYGEVARCCTWDATARKSRRLPR
jgi:hypothetical protein